MATGLLYNALRSLMRYMQDFQGMDRAGIIACTKSAILSLSSIIGLIWSSNITCEEVIIN